MYNVQFPELGLQFQVNPVAFSIGGFNVQWYGVIIGVGFLLAIIYGFKSCKSMNINSDGLFDAIIAGLIFGVIGARLYYVIFYPGDKYLNDPLLIFNVREGGLGIYGGVVGGLLAGAIVAKIKKLSVGAVLDVASIGYLIGQGIGRWGNFVNQEAFGYATTMPWGMTSERTQLEVVGNVHPCFLYESILCLLGFVALHFFTKHLRRYDGQTFLLYIVWYGTSRFFIEGLRTDSLLVPGLDIRVSQALAALTVIAAVVMLVIFARRTSLSGCGSRKIMELNGIVLGNDGKKVKEEVAPEESTIFKGRKYMDIAQGEGNEPEKADEALKDDPEEKAAGEARQAEEAAPSEEENL